MDRLTLLTASILQGALASGRWAEENTELIVGESVKLAQAVLRDLNTAPPEPDASAPAEKTRDAAIRNLARVQVVSAPETPLPAEPKCLPSCGTEHRGCDPQCPWRWFEAGLEDGFKEGHSQGKETSQDALLACHRALSADITGAATARAVDMAARVLWPHDGESP